MLFKVLKGFDAIACSTRLYNAGLFYFKTVPRDLTTAGYYNWVFVMSQLNVGPEGEQQRAAFNRVIQATAATFGDVIVTDTDNLVFSEEGKLVPVTIPPDPSAGASGITKLISGNNAGDCATALLDSGLIVSKNQIDGTTIKVASHPELRGDNADQSRDFDLVVKATAGTFDDAKVTDFPADSV
jgi:hypothetical protein